MDRNGNNSPEDTEWLDGMTVQLTTTTGAKLTEKTVKGIVTFDMSNYAPGTGVNVSLPGLYRSESFILPAQGVVPVRFMFTQPALPTKLP